MKRLVIISHGPFFKNKRGELVSRGNTHQIAELAKHFDTVWYSYDNDTIFEGENNNPPGVVLKSLFTRKKESLIDLLCNLRVYKKKIEAVVKEEGNALFYVYVPGKYFGLLAAHVLKKHKKRFFIRFISDAPRIFKQASWRNKVLSPVVVPLLDILIQHIVRDVPTFYSGYVIYPDLPKQEEMLSASFSKKDIYHRKKIFPRKPYKILAIGSFVRHKGMEFVVRAFSLLTKEERESLELIIVANDKGGERIRELARKNKVDITLKTNIFSSQDVYQEYKRADMVVVPPLTDKQPRVVMEAMAFGLPVIATKVGTVPKFVKHKKTGLLVKPGAANEIADAIRLLVKDKQLRERIVKNAYRIAEKSTLEKQMEEMHKLFRKYFPDDAW